MQVRSLDSENIKKFSLKRSQGSVVEYVLPNTPALRAGVLAGDVVYGINGRQVTSTYLLQEAISSVGSGAPVRLAIDRGGQTLELQVTTTDRPMAPRVDPVMDMESYLRVRFVEDTRRKEVVIRDARGSLRAPGLYEGSRIKSVLPAQDWTEEPITLSYYRIHAKPTPIDGLADLRAALARAYQGGRVAMAFEIDNPLAPIAAVAWDEIWPIIL
jgi:membrane-associated protease RseP (regulator of RpoE activity)